MKRVKGLLVLQFVISTCLLSMVELRAATVTTCDEAGLRAAIAQGGTVTFACDGIITLTNTLVIAQDGTLDATGHDVVLSGNNAVRVLQVLPGVSLKLVNLVVANGRSTNGGGIFNQGNLTLSGCTIATNTAEGIAGANGIAGTNGAVSTPLQPVPTTPGGNGGNGESGQEALGGGLCNLGGVTITSSSFAGNRVIGGGGGNAGHGGLAGYVQGGSIGVRSCNVPGAAGLAGAGGNAFGAAFYNSGEANVSASSFTGNSAVGGVGGLGGVDGGNPCSPSARPTTQAGQGGAAQGGGWFNAGILSIKRCLAAQNNALGGAGGDAPEVSGSPTAGRGGNGGNAAGGAGVSTSSNSVANTTIIANKAVGGRSGFSAHYSGACPAPGGNGGNAEGGALLNLGDLSLLSLTIWNNAVVAGYPTNTYPAGCPSASYNLGSPGQAYGSSVVASNPATLTNSIVGGYLSTSNCVGLIVDGGYNICSDSSASFTAPTSRNSIDPLLGPLANNGGPTLTMFPLPGSPAIDAGSYAAWPDIDQRGVHRPQGTRADIGAVEAAFLILHRQANDRVLPFYSGITGESYTLETTARFGEPWFVVETLLANTKGAVTYSSISHSNTQQFFRVKSP